MVDCLLLFHWPAGVNRPISETADISILLFVFSLIIDIDKERHSLLILRQLAPTRARFYLIAS